MSHEQWETEFRQDRKAELDARAAMTETRSRSSASTAVQSDTNTEAGRQWRGLRDAGLLWDGSEWTNYETPVQDNERKLSAWLVAVATPPNAPVIVTIFEGEVLAEESIWNDLPSQAIDLYSRWTVARSYEALGLTISSEGSWSEVVSSCLRLIIDHIHEFKCRKGYVLRLQPQHKLDNKVTRLLSIPSVPNYVLDFSVGYEPLHLVGGSRELLASLRRVVESTASALGFDTMYDSALFPFLIIEVKASDGDLEKGKRQIFAPMMATLKATFDLEQDPALQHLIQSRAERKFRDDVIYGLIPRGDRWHFFGMTLVVGTRGDTYYVPHEFLSLNFAHSGEIRHAHHVIHRILSMGRQRAERYLPLVQAVAARAAAEAVNIPLPPSTSSTTAGNPVSQSAPHGEATPRPAPALLMGQRTQRLRTFQLENKQPPRGIQSIIATAEWAKSVAKSRAEVGLESSSIASPNTHQDVPIWERTSTLVGTGPTEGDDIQNLRSSTAVSVPNFKTRHLINRSRSWSSPSGSGKVLSRGSLTVQLHLPSAGNLDVSRMT